MRWEADCASVLLRFRTVRTSEALDALVGLLPNPGHTWKHSDLLCETCRNRTSHTCFVLEIHMMARVSLMLFRIIPTVIHLSDKHSD